MKNTLFSLSFFILGATGLVACGSANNAVTCAAGSAWNGSACAVTSTSLTQTGMYSCAAGQVSTAQGCLPQGNCQANQGWNGSACLAATTPTGTCGPQQVLTQMGCLNQGGPCVAGQGWAPQTNTCYQGIGGYMSYNTPYANGYNNGGNNNGGLYYGYQNGTYTGPCDTVSYVMTATGCMPRCSYFYNNGHCANQ